MFYGNVSKINEFVTMTKENKRDINYTDNEGMTALMYAVINGKLDVVKDLLSKGADSNIKDRSEWTPLLWAIRGGHESITELLINNDAEINAKDNNGMTPLMCAVKSSQLNTVKLLISRGADIYAENNDGMTAYQLSVNYNHREKKGKKFTVAQCDCLRCKAQVEISELLCNLREKEEKEVVNIKTMGSYDSFISILFHHFNHIIPCFCPPRNTSIPNIIKINKIKTKNKKSNHFKIEEKEEREEKNDKEGKVGHKSDLKKSFHNSKIDLHKNNVNISTTKNSAEISEQKSHTSMTSSVSNLDQIITSDFHTFSSDSLELGKKYINFVSSPINLNDRGYDDKFGQYVDFHKSISIETSKELQSRKNMFDSLSNFY